MAASIIKAEELKTAFQLFSRQSGLIEQSYQQLQSQVETLTHQLRVSQSRRLSELVKKERLSQHLGHLLESMPGAIIVINGDGIIRESNSRATALLNQPLLGCSWATIVRREVSAGGSEDGNLQLRDGRWLSLSRRALQQEPGEVLLLSDITESRQFSALRQRQERLSAIGEMTAKFAHQVRTPLASAMLHTAQLDRNSSKQQKVVQKIAARLNDLSRMIDDMLGFAAGAKRSQNSVNVYNLLTEVQLAIEPQLDKASNLRVQIDDYRLQIAANKDALKGVLLNLISNAAQACSSAAEIVLRAKRKNGFVEISVSDNGSGIAEDVLPHLFEPFFTTRPQGTGLGLAVVQAVVAAHDGEVEVATSANGSRFTLLLPASAGSESGE